MIRRFHFFEARNKPGLIVTEAEEIIAKLNLKPLPHEGGYFTQSWKSAETLADGRPAATSIYFLLTSTEFSAFHRLRGVEIWHFYAGSAVEHFQLSSKTGLVRKLMGPDMLAGQVPQLIVPAEAWQAARVAAGAEGAVRTEAWALLGCTMSPGWDDRDFVLGTCEQLIADFSAHASLIRALTRANEEIPHGKI